MADSERKVVPGGAEDTTLEQMGYQQGELILFGLNYQEACAMLQGVLGSSNPRHFHCASALGQRLWN
jgi:hypothetical protein